MFRAVSNLMILAIFLIAVAWGFGLEMNKPDFFMGFSSLELVLLLAVSTAMCECFSSYYREYAKESLRKQ